MSGRNFFLLLLVAALSAMAVGCTGGGDSECTSAGSGIGITPTATTCGTGGSTGGGGTGGTSTNLRMGSFSGSTFTPEVIKVTNSSGQVITTVNGGSSATLSVAIVDATNTPIIDSSSATVQFGSICASQGLAEFSPVSKTLTSGGAQVQYTALGCNTTDKIFATTTINGKTLTATASVITTPCTGSCTSTGSEDPGLPGGIVKIVTSDTQLLSAKDSEAEAITVTVLVKDSNNLAKKDVTVNLSASSGALILSDAASVKTNSTGSVTAKLHTGGDPSLRTITLTANVKGATAPATATLDVTGTKITVDGPTSITAGTQSSPLTYTFIVTNSAGEPIANEPVTLTNTIGTPVTCNGSTSVPTKTDVLGQLKLCINTVDAAGGSSRLLTATALGGAAPITAVTTTLSATIADASLSFVSNTPSANQELALGGNSQFSARITRSSSATDLTGCDITFATTRGTFGGANNATTVIPVIAGNNADASAAFNAGSIAGKATVSARVVQRNGAATCSVTQLVITREVELVSVSPTRIDVQPNPATVATNGGRSTIVATVRDGANNPVKNQVVNFSIENYSSGSLTSPSATTGSDGQATVGFIAGAASATNGVKINARVGSGAIANSTTLTVGGQAVRVNIGFGNTLVVNTDLTTYKLPVVVSVTDAAGNPASGAVVNLALRATAYQKGHYVKGDDLWLPQYNVTPKQSTTDPLEPSFGCLNEDRSNEAGISPENGILDGKTGGNTDGDGNDAGVAAGNDGQLEIAPNTVVGEDINDNGQLDPDNPATIPASVTLGSDGTKTFEIVYPKSHGNWLQIRIRATTLVGGTEGKATSFVTLAITADDAALDKAPPGASRAINDLNGDGVADDTDPNTAGVQTTPIPVVGSPYGERNTCRIAS